MKKEPTDILDRILAGCVKRSCSPAAKRWLRRLLVEGECAAKTYFRPFRKSPPPRDGGNSHA